MCKKFLIIWAPLCVFAGVMMVGFAPAVMAQEDAEPTEDEMIEAALEVSFEEEITVTGTLIPRPTLDALSPVTVMGPEEIMYSGVTRIEDLMATLPQAFAGQNSTWANGASGTASVDLRSLGSNRTLVLINGRRTAPGSARGIYAPDLNFIPGFMLKRIDVLTGGASSVYGTDAVAGVVNFILDTDFEGMKGDIQYSFYQHDNNNSLAQEMNDMRGFDYPTGSVSDGEGVNLNLAFGGKFADGKGYASAYVGYRKADEVTKGMRDYLTCSAWATEDGPLCGGSATTDRGTFILDDGSYAMVDPNTGNFVPWDGYRFNYASYNHIQRPDERWSAGAFLNYEFNEHAEGYMEFMFMDDSTDAQIAPSGDFGVTGSINCDNPMLSEQQREFICGQFGYSGDDIAPMVTLRRNVEGAGRSNAIRHTTYRLLAGVRGEINDQWSYDLYGLHAQTNNAGSYNNDLNIARIINALDIIEDPDTGEWVCRSGDDGCVPWNIFTPGAVTQEAIDYMTTVAVGYGKTMTEVVNATFTGDLEDYGWAFSSANEGIQVAIGSEYREEALSRQPDEVYLNGAAAGFGGPVPLVDGEFNVKELFIEALVPIIQDAPLAQDLSLELGYRYSDYSTSGAANTYKVMGAWAPTTSFGFRGGINRAIRSANIFELFRPQGFGLGGSEDICAGPNPTATLEECRNTGVTDAQYGNVPFNPAGQYNTLGGGNPDLNPEVADTLTFGIVITPEGLPGFSATLDYYDIQIEDEIDAFAYNDIMTTCARTGDEALCSLIHRGPTGDLWYSYQLGGGYVETTQQNVGERYAEGIDLNVAYMFSLGKAGYLNTGLTGTYVLANRSANPLRDYDCVGYFGFQCGQPQSEWRHRAQFTWETNFKTVFNLTWRYVGTAENDDYSPDEDLRNEGNWDMWAASGSDKVGGYNYLDLAATVNITNSIQFSLGCNNITDKEPPMWPDLQDDQYVNTYATYDPLGRYVFTSLRFTF